MAPQARTAAAFLAGGLRLAQGQFGGGGFGGAGGFAPPAPICPAFTCPTGEKAAPQPDLQIISYGCKDSGMNFLNAGSFNADDPLAGLKSGGKNLNKCCIERDICKQTCGATSKECHDGYQKCQAKICKGDQNCQLQGMISELSNDPYDTDKYGGAAKDEKYDPEEVKCRGYNKAQEAACQCVPKAEAKNANEAKLKAFYAKHNPEKLDDMGDIKDVDEVWKKWKGKEQQMFMALATKYKEKAVSMREKPKWDPPPPKDADSQDFARDSPTASVTEPAEVADGDDPEAGVFASKLQEVEDKKKKAKEDEEYDLAAELKVEAATLKTKEVGRLNAKKSEAIEAEDYKTAKKIKARIAKLEL